MSKAFVGEKLHHSFYRPTSMHCVKGRTGGRIRIGSLFEPVEEKIPQAGCLFPVTTVIYANNLCPSNLNLKA